jgi:transcription elongation GreA/GreB family factor
VSRAFVKEDDGAPEPPRAERPISAAPNRVTERGARLILQQVRELKAALGENPDEETAVTLRRELRYWQSRQASMQLVAPPASLDVVGFGCRVTMRRGSNTDTNTNSSTITIVGEDEADPATGLIAWTAPLARALEGAEVNDSVELDAGGRRESITVLAIARGDEGIGNDSH